MFGKFIRDNRNEQTGLQNFVWHLAATGNSRFAWLDGWYLAK